MFELNIKKFAQCDLIYAILKKKSSRYFLPNSFIKSFGTEYEHKAEASVHLQQLCV